LVTVATSSCSARSPAATGSDSTFSGSAVAAGAASLTISGLIYGSGFFASISGSSSDS